MIMEGKKEQVRSQHGQDVDIPDSILIFYDSFIIEDHVKHRMFLAANGHGQDCEAGMRELRELVRRAETLAEAVFADPVPSPARGGPGEFYERGLYGGRSENDPIYH